MPAHKKWYAGSGPRTEGAKAESYDKDGLFEYGEKNIEIEESLLKPLRKWLRHNESDYLLINTKGSPLNSNGITKTLNRIGMSERGKPFGSSILRHSSTPKNPLVYFFIFLRKKRIGG
jgi:hypothetical protein